MGNEVTGYRGIIKKRSDALRLLDVPGARLALVMSTRWRALAEFDVLVRSARDTWSIGRTVGRERIVTDDDAELRVLSLRNDAFRGYTFDAVYVPEEEELTREQLAYVLPATFTARREILTAAGLLDDAPAGQA